MRPGSAYSVLMIIGILLAAWVWGRITRSERRDPRLTYIYIAALAGAIVGAKAAFLLAEGWAYEDDWLALLTGRSITGALLGGYTAVELAKRRLRYASATGDAFAVIVPMGLILGRVGCLIEGCCQGAVCEAHWWTLTVGGGHSRWPIVPMEIAFNGAMLAFVLLARHRSWLPGNLFHLYLIAYGLFRFATEFARDTTRLDGTSLSGYHLIALTIVVLGVERFVKRSQSANAPRIG